MIQEIVGIAGVSIAALGLIITVIVEWRHIVSGTNAARRRLASIPRPAVSRRVFLGVAGAIGTAAAVYYLGRLADIRSILPWRRGGKLPEAFVQNAKTGVMHHIAACTGHLPAEANRLEFQLSSSASRIHLGRQPYIAEVIAKGSSDETTIPILVNAIKRSPTSTHLYKYLIGVWGKRKEYDRIHEFLAANIEYLESKQEQEHDNPKARRRYAKALQDLQQRRARAHYLARVSSVIN